MNTTEAEHFCLSGCGRPLPRQVGYCPFCGQAQNLSPQNTETEKPEAPLVDKDLVAQMPVVPPQVSPPTAGADEKPESPRQENKNLTDTSLPTKTEQVVKPPLKPKSNAWLWVGAAIAAVLALVLTMGSGSAVKVEAMPDKWSPVDVSGFPSGTRIVIAAPGAFRLRSTYMAPVLVTSDGGDVELSDLPRQGLEIRSATNSALTVVLRKEK